MLIHEKIDAQGNYLEFPGVTVIADVDNKDKDFWLHIYGLLNGAKKLRSYYAPLPCSSYHMTTNNLYTESDAPNNWPTLLNDERFQHLHAKLTANSFTPTAKIVAIKASYALQLNLILPQSQYTLVKAIADEFGIENKIPQTFHVTLAYAYKELSDVQIIAPEIERLASLCLKKEFTMRPPRLCFFHDMQQFFSWDGKNNPFKMNAQL
ncbi:DUF1868 domain-containing protein [Legionella rowbothamii]|uniref:DUF1868 domain-containing protein n=1 Tax=Legionella rowbothamii TaxID=96229 RepID=UPI0010565ACF|nr:DUF1868 domain-containing protein [Legionella rowbothamii]